MKANTRALGLATMAALLLTTSATPVLGAALTSFADIAEPALSGVVNIRTTTPIRGKNPALDPYQFFLGGSPSPSNNTSLGSGVIIDRQGHILTNHHVIDGASTIQVIFARSKQRVDARLVGSDPKTDLAVLRVRSSERLSPLDFGDSDGLRVGDVVLAIGNPFGYAHTVTNGIISAKGRVIGTGPLDNFLQTDAPIHAGNSGGPLLDTRGRVIGINTAVAAEAPGIGFAIPSNMAARVMRDLIKHGKVIRPWLGIVGKDILSADEVPINTGDKLGVHGVIVTNLVVDGPAQKAGLQMGDLIMGFDSTEVSDVNHLQQLLFKKGTSDTARVRVYRRSRGVQNYSVPLEATPSARDLPSERDLF